MTQSANIIRQQFIDFFKSKGHKFVYSSPVVPQDDPTLLFTNAGMNQFKAIFLGENRDNLKRVANSQKCMRVSGKHNDLEEVGVDHYHHTFFEMLGNWSFGDYYKKEAIGWAWELVTGVWNIPKKSLYSTVYKDDDEAEGLWKRVTDIEHSHISRHGNKDNFWEMGETGPCGPCSELHLDTGVCSTEGKSHVCGVNVAGCDRFLEIWNLVFIQYNREKDGSLKELPAKHVDTGMGFERIVRIIQNKKSNYDTDVFMPIIKSLERLASKAYTPDAAGTPFRVIADHVRSLTVAITDGAFPSNEGRGYVLRRLLRRAYRFGRILGFTEPFIYKLVPVVVQTMGSAFPELTSRSEHVMQIVRSEEERFDQTLEQGLEKINFMIERAGVSSVKKLGGADVFALYDTYGFPMDLTRLIAAEKGFSIDEAGFESLMESQRNRGRDAAKAGGDDGLSSDGWVEILQASGTEFAGYEYDEIPVKVERYKITAPSAADATCTDGLLVLDRTPFYAEMGGQAGDSGELVAHDATVIGVVNTIKWNDMIVHKIHSDTPFASALLHKPLVAKVNKNLRNDIKRNHSATHLLQAALIDVLGSHVSQSGSRVSADGLRFDFNHFKALTQEETVRVEDLVNEWIMADVPVATTIKTPAEAKKEGATALFGEKYGDTVRVVSMGGLSKELCGGTHVSATGQIGQFHITAESSIAAGVRRIEAVTGIGSLHYLRAKEQLVSDMANTLKVNESSLVQRVQEVSLKVRELETEVSRLSQASAGQEIALLFDRARAQKNAAFPFVVQDLGVVDKKRFGDLSDSVSDIIRREKLDTMVIFLAAAVDGKALFSAAAGKSAVEAHGVHCGELVKTAAQKTGGGGGGSSVRAQAGGRDCVKIKEAVAAAETILRQKAGLV